MLLNRDEYAQVLADKNTFLTFDFGDEIQPRLGRQLSAAERAGDKVYANYGRYYAMDQKSSARSLAPSRMFFTDTVFRSASTGAVISSLTAGKHNRKAD